MNVKVLEPCLEHSKQTKYFDDDYYRCFLEELIRLCFGINFSFHFWYIGWIRFLYTFLWALNVIMLLNSLIMYPIELYRVKMSQAAPKGNFMVGRSLEQNCSPVSQPCRLRDWEMSAKLSETLFACQNWPWTGVSLPAWTVVPVKFDFSGHQAECPWAVNSSNNLWEPN